jgi:hypothetical protein
VKTIIVFCVATILTLVSGSAQAECYDDLERVIPCVDPKDGKLPFKLKTVPELNVVEALYCDAANAVRNARKSESDRSLDDQKVTITFSPNRVQARTNRFGAGVSGILLEPLTLGASGNISQTQTLEEKAPLGPGDSTVGELAGYCNNFRQIRSEKEAQWLYPYLTQRIEYMEQRLKNRKPVFYQPVSYSRTVRIIDDSDVGLSIKFLGLFEITSRTQAQLQVAHTVEIKVDMKGPPKVQWWAKCQPYCRLPTGAPNKDKAEMPEVQRTWDEADAVRYCRDHGYPTATISPNTTGYGLLCNNSIVAAM